MADKQAIAWQLTPIFEEPSGFRNAGTTRCLASGEHLLGTSIGEALSPSIVSMLRQTDGPRMVVDANLIDAAVSFLRGLDNADAARIAEALDPKATKLSDEDTLPTDAEKRQQGKRCPCGGHDDWCGCQNVTDATTMARRA